MSATEVGMRRLSNFVDGKLVDPHQANYSEVIDPSTGDAYLEAPVSDASDVDLAFRAAKDAFPTWRDMTPSERSLALLRIADAVEARAEALVCLLYTSRCV